MRRSVHFLDEKGITMDMREEKGIACRRFRKRLEQEAYQRLRDGGGGGRTERGRVFVEKIRGL